MEHRVVVVVCVCACAVVCVCRRPKKIEIREDTRTGEVFLAGSDSLYTLVESMRHAREIIQAGVRLLFFRFDFD